MTLIAITALILGIICGAWGADNSLILKISEHKDLILYILMFSVGISIGMHRGFLKKIRQYHIKIFLIPLGTILGSLLGGVLCSLMTGCPLSSGTAAASGLGWYSLAGITLESLSGAQMGSTAFLSNLMREIFSFFSIPFLSKKLNGYACIAAAGATSEDTTLPMMIKYTDEETVVFSVINGVICSAFVPVLISLCYALFT